MIDRGRHSILGIRINAVDYDAANFARCSRCDRVGSCARRVRQNERGADAEACADHGATRVQVGSHAGKIQGLLNGSPASLRLELLVRRAERLARVRERKSPLPESALVEAHSR